MVEIVDALLVVLTQNVLLRTPVMDSVIQAMNLRVFDSYDMSTRWDVLRSTEIVLPQRAQGVHSVTLLSGARMLLFDSQVIARCVATSSHRNINSCDSFKLRWKITVSWCPL
jgi:hypothetical protein